MWREGCPWGWRGNEYYKRGEVQLADYLDYYLPVMEDYGGNFEGIL